MTSEACNVVLEREDSQKYLARLSRRGLFVTASEESPRTYEFHPLFRAFLLESMEGADPRGLRRLRRKAAEYHLEQGSMEQAVDLLVEAGSFSRAGKLAEQQAEVLLERGRVQTLERWAETLRQGPATIPYIYLSLSMSRFNRGDLDEAEVMLARANKLISPKASKNIKASAEIAKGFISYRRGDYDAAIRSADRIPLIYEKRKNRRKIGMGLRIKALAVFA
jgi:ATP/maltotriose-dependent transcriptional regulator MalT